MRSLFSFPVRRTACAALWGAVVLGVLVVERPQAAHAQAMTQADTVRIAFDEAVRTALDQNTDIKRAQASARQANTEVRSEWMDFAPNLNLNLRADRSFGRTFNQVIGDVITRTEDRVGGSVSSNVTLFNGFENTTSLNQARRQADADETSLKRTRREVVFTVMDQYISLIESREIIRVRREELEARRQQLRQIEEFVDAGSRPVSDRYQEEANVAEAEQQLLQARREREVNSTRLIQTSNSSPEPYRL
jgi:Outer membrane protein